MKSYLEACKILELDATNVSITTVRKQYKMMALKYHPDKNKSPDANARYQAIKEAHDFLLNNSGSINETHSTWTTSVSSFFETLYNNEHLQKRVFHPLFMRIIETLCISTVYRIFLSHGSRPFFRKSWSRMSL